MTGFGTMRMIEREKPERTAAGLDAYGGKTGKAFLAGTAALAVCAIRKHTAARKAIRSSPDIYPGCSFCVLVIKIGG